jgi:putative SOS response-associated peptidase YedK
MARDALRGEPDALGLPGQERIPGSPCLAVCNDPRHGGRLPTTMVWGILKPNRRPILHLAAAPALRSRSQRFRRCLIITPGFIQRGASGWARRRRFEITSSEGGPLALAALYDEGLGTPRFALVTTDPNDFFAPLHARLPIILPGSVWPEWLSPAPLSPELVEMISEPCPASWLRLSPVPLDKLYGPAPTTASDLKEIAPGAELARPSRKLAAFGRPQEESLNALG